MSLFAFWAGGGVPQRLRVLVFFEKKEAGHLEEGGGVFKPHFPFKLGPGGGGFGWGVTPD